MRRVVGVMSVCERVLRPVQERKNILRWEDLAPQAGVNLTVTACWSRLRRVVDVMSVCERVLRPVRERKNILRWEDLAPQAGVNLTATAS